MRSRAQVRAALVVAIAMTTGCAAPEVVQCDDGRLCPLGTLCVPLGCAAAGCGDGDVDAFFGEQCDDGNQLVGDGCSPTCQFELCGNQILDPTSGEECDDGNLVSHDGCSSGCLVEHPSWHQLLAPQSSPSARRSAVAAWDPDRGQAILHGGVAPNGTLADVWIFDGAWHLGPLGPPPMAGHGMAWDGRDALVLFGDAPEPCWIWTGSWARCTGSTPTRRAAPLASRPGGGVIMLGGQVPDATTWLWDGTSWTAGVMGPPSFSSSLVEDRVQRRVMLVGSSDSVGTTWAFDTAWSALGADYPRSGFPASYDGDRRRVIVYGGADAGGLPQGDLHEFVDDRWQQVPATDAPEGREDAVTFYDPIRRGLVMLGGASGGNDATTWILRWESATRDESCVDATADTDADGLAGCDDPDCWGRCDPRCSPGVPDCAADRPRCGDGACNPALETPLLCPKDCP